MSDVFFNGQLVGTVDSAEQFVSSVVEARRQGKLSKYINIQYRKALDTVYILLERDRVVRPLIVVKDSKPLLTPEHMERLKSGEIKSSDLVKDGIIEFLDCLEEENAFIAMNEEQLTKDHTHMEINPIAIFGMTTSLVAYANYNQSSKQNRGQKTQKQAMGCYTLSFPNRMDTAVNLLHYPQVPLVRTATQSLLGDERASGQNIVIAVINMDGYNMSDSLVINKGSIDRGLGRSTYFRPYPTEKLRYPGGQVDEIMIPNKDVQGYTVERDYRFLTPDGIIYPEAEVGGGEVLIGKTSPPRFLGKLEAFSSAANIRKDTSVRTRYGEAGVVNKVIITEEEGGSMLIKVDVRETRIPEVGDKFSSRPGQKGVLGKVMAEEDVPFTASGIKPDIIFSPNGLPKRMTVAQLIEALGGKLGALAGKYIDGTPFLNDPVNGLRKQLLELGFRDDGTEVLYDGRTGQQFPARIFVGNMYYLRLKHQVADKIQSRARGPIALLTRQPTEGKAKEGGLRLGEMEKECFIAHGASLLMKERFDSDKTVIWICERCGDIAIHDVYKNKAFCLCGEKTKVSPVELSYAFKLFVDEMKSLHIRPKLKLKEKY
ncbi:MAG TPA: DNA-directed RNA polymerase subunit B [Candidatus Nanoarchaeia archaeon]|nr:DNA-directed RNA polymerase subunit B [Candidatus Nanoarchaeia archaeon]